MLDNIKYYLKLWGFRIFLFIASGVIITYSSTAIIYLISNALYRGNAAKNVIAPYMANSTEATITMPAEPQFIIRDIYPDEKWKDSTKFFYCEDTHYHQSGNQTYSKILRKQDGSNEWLNITFYSAAYKKYFEIILPDFKYNASDLFIYVLPLKELIITFNKDDFNNPLYGSAKNPVPVFKYRGVSPLLYKGKNFDITAGF
jgi:hypothetical protein